MNDTNTTTKPGVLNVMAIAAWGLPKNGAAELREARATVERLAEACGLQAHHYKGGYFLTKADGETPFSGKAHEFQSDAMAEREEAIDAALAAFNGEQS